MRRRATSGTLRPERKYSLRLSPPFLVKSRPTACRKEEVGSDDRPVNRRKSHEGREEMGCSSRRDPLAPEVTFAPVAKREDLRHVTIMQHEERSDQTYENECLSTRYLSVPGVLAAAGCTVTRHRRPADELAAERVKPGIIDSAE